VGVGKSLLIDHAAARLNVSRRTIYNAIRDGRLQTVTVGSSQRVLETAVLAWEAAQRKRRAEQKIAADFERLAEQN